MTYREYKQTRLVENPFLQEEYDALSYRYQLIEEVISARIEKHMTQADLAKRADTRQSNISRFESGNYNPSIDFLQKIAVALDKELLITLR